MNSGKLYVYRVETECCGDFFCLAPALCKAAYVMRKVLGLDKEWHSISRVKPGQLAPKRYVWMLEDDIPKRTLAKFWL